MTREFKIGRWREILIQFEAPRLQTKAQLVRASRGKWWKSKIRPGPWEKMINKELTLYGDFYNYLIYFLSVCLEKIINS